MLRYFVPITLRAALRYVLPGALLAFWLAGCGGSGGGHTLVADLAPPDGRPAPHFKPGDVVSVADTWVVTVNAVASSQGAPGQTPRAGDAFVVITVTLKNLTRTPQALSSILQFRLIGSDGVRYDQAVATFLTPPDGTVDPGGTTTGQVAYETPDALRAFTFGFQADVTGAALVNWDLALPG